MRPSRAAGERARWLSALLILTAIAAISSVIEQWPARRSIAPAPTAARSSASTPTDTPSTPQRVPPVLLASARSVPPRLLAAPRSAESTSQIRVQLTDAPVTAAEPPPAIEPVSFVTPVEPAVREHAPLPSRRIEMPILASSTTAEPLLEARVDDFDLPFGLVELPAAAVTRAVTVAGRGILSGLRLTSAVLRAPF